MKGVYLIHFSRPHKHARHYLGYAKDIDARIERHRKSHGARLLAVLNSKGIEWKVVRIWENKTKAYEKKLKRWKNSPKLCPICKGEKHEVSCNARD